MNQPKQMNKCQPVCALSETNILQCAFY